MTEFEEYQAFVNSKLRVQQPKGLLAPTKLNKHLRPFQRHLVKRSLELGRSALFASTGLGKTLMQLVFAAEVCRQQQGKALIVAPLAVSSQTIAEARKFEVADVSYAPQRRDIKTQVSITNYERFERFDMDEFCVVVLDESSILKSFDGKLRRLLVDSCRRVPYRMCATATPAPNDFVELGNHAEFLGICNFEEMLATYFVHDGGILLSEKGGAGGWRLKRHAVRDFWRWIAGWASVLQHPKDLGFEETGYDLPPLNVKQIMVKNEWLNYDGLLSRLAGTLSERRQARKHSIEDRVHAALKIIESKTEPWLVWCALNREAEEIARLLPDALEVRGSDTQERKAERLLGFCNGKPRILVTKPRIGGFGMNWQHCSNMVFLGLNDSFEQMFQSIRRCWRFGQIKAVDVYVVLSAQEGDVLRNIQRKEKDYTTMMGELSRLMTCGT